MILSLKFFERGDLSMIRNVGMLLVATILIAGSASVALSEELQFQRAKREGELVLKNCSLIDGAQRAVILNGRFVWVRGSKALAKTDKVKLGTRYSSFACAPSSSDPTKTALFARKDTTTAPVELLFTPESFPAIRSQLPFACKRIEDFPSLYVYKTLGSEDFSDSDCRRRTVGVYVRLGGERISTSCVQIRDSLGNVVAKLGSYNPPGEYEFRGYGCYGCGRSTPYGGEQVADRARRNTGSTEIYIDAGDVCYGPLEANTCENSSQC